jgi:serine/threonine protein kinase
MAGIGQGRENSAVNRAHRGAALPPTFLLRVTFRYTLPTDEDGWDTMTIAAHDWLALSRLLDTALSLPPAERASWVEGLGGDQAELKSLLRELLGRQDLAETGNFLATLPKFTGPPELVRIDAKAGDVIGPYRLERALGAGGMGSVWLAERIDGLLKRKIALKLPHLGGNLAGLAERMTRERNILATLEHPSIARLYDAGIAEDARPYLALEYVEGEPIDRYCERHGLNIAARIELALQVAGAVAYAHTRLVVHRDLKPSNILVDAQGRVHLLDFGIAKLLDQGGSAQTQLTQAGSALTPEYASPEQLRGEAIGTPSDVYSLGVVLYELLAGTRPFKLQQKANALALAQAVLSSEPLRPSDAATDAPARRQLRGDLDTIILKALKKSPVERYATVSEFAEDIQRYVQGDPVRARPDSNWYRARKFVTRNALLVGAAASILLALAAGLAIALWQVQVARTEQRRAEDVKQFVASMFQAGDPYFGGGKQTTAVQLLAAAKTRVDSELKSQPATAVELLAIIGESLVNMGQVDAAEQALTEAVARGKRELAPGSLPTAIALARLAFVRERQFRFDEARALVDEAVPMLRRFGATGMRALSSALEDSSFIAYSQSDFPRAERDGEEAVAIARIAFGTQDFETNMAMRGLADAYLHEGKPDKAYPIAEQAFRAASLSTGGTGANVLLVDTELTYGSALVQTGHPEDGITHLETAARNAEAIYGPNSDAAASSYSWLSIAYRKLGDLAPAITQDRRALAIYEQQTTGVNSTVLTGVRIGLARLLLQARQSQQAIDTCAGISAPLLEQYPEGDRHRTECQRIDGLALAYLGHLDDANAVILANIAARRPGEKTSLAESLGAMGALQGLRGKWQDSAQWYQQALDVLAASTADSTARAEVLAGIGLAVLELDQVEAAEARLREGNQMYARLYKKMNPGWADTLVGLGRISLEQNKAGDAVPMLSEADSFWRQFDSHSRWANEAAYWLGRAQRAAL